jgi:hypothetical protein
MFYPVVIQRIPQTGDSAELKQSKPTLQLSKTDFVKLSEN